MTLVPARPAAHHLIFPALTHPALRHGVFTRAGGVSPPPWQSLNAGFHVGDSQANVLENRDRIKQALGLERLVSLQQVHGATVRIVTDRPAGDVELAAADALLTDLAGVGLMIQQADCQAVLLFDPARPAVGIAHAGWRGSVVNIIAASVHAMQENYGSRPDDLLAAVSPGLGPCCAEFRNFRHELPAGLHAYQVAPNHFDFWAVSRDQLLAAGLQPARITIAGRCTVCDRRFFSYRRDRLCGRSASVIGLRDNVHSAG